MEGAINRLPDLTSGVTKWLLYMKDQMRQDADRSSLNWTFYSNTDVDTTADIVTAQLGFNDKGTLTREVIDVLWYGMLMCAQTNETGDGLVVQVFAEDADPTVDGEAVNFDLDTANTGYIAQFAPASDGNVVAYTPVIWPGGLRMTTAATNGDDEIWVAATDNEGNDIAASGLSVYLVGKIITVIAA